MDKNARILITGATGMVGFYVAEKVRKAGYHNLGLLVRSQSRTSHLEGFGLVEVDFDDDRNILENLENASIVIHCAASISGSREELQKGNPELTKKIVDACLAQGVEKLIYLSSVACLDRWRRGMTTEENILRDRTRATEYAYSKYLSELEVHRGMAEGMPAVILYPSQILGLFYKDNPNTKLWDRIIHQKHFYPIGSIGVVDVRDVAQAVHTVLDLDLDSGQFILNSVNVTFKDLFNAFKHKMNLKLLTKPLSSWLHRHGSFVFSLYYFFTRFRLNHPYTNKYLRQLAFPFAYDNTRSKEILNMQYRSLDSSLSDIAGEMSKFEDSDFLSLPG